MSITILEGTKETLDEMRGQKFVPHSGEGVVYLKLVMITPDTMEKDDPAQAVEAAPGIILCGQLSEIQAQIQTWFGESAAEYCAKLNKVDPDVDVDPNPQPTQDERW